MSRRHLSVLVSVLAVLAVWAALAAPSRLADLHLGGFVWIPAEGLVLLALVLVVPVRVRRPLTVILGVGLALLVVLKALDIGFRLSLGRPFNAVTDGDYIEPAVGVLSDSIGTPGAVAALAGIALAVVGLLVGLPAATARLATLCDRHRGTATAATLALALLWCPFAAYGRGVAGAPVAGAPDVALVTSHVDRAQTTIRDTRRFDRRLAMGATAPAPTDSLLTGLRGKDVLVVFVESYGRYALQGPSSARVTATLQESMGALREEGFAARSAILTSPTFGGVSWLAHSTLQSGLWIDNERRYDSLLASGHPTLMSRFDEAGWRTVMVIPSSRSPWPRGKGFYGFDRMYGTKDLGYAGPRFGYAKVPDQFTLGAFHRLELADTERGPVMAEIDLSSSHHPWAPLPRLVPWEDLGDGSVYEPMPEQGPSKAEVWSDSGRIRAAYTSSIVYSLRSVTQFLLRYGDEDTVVLLLGDHQPNAIITGPGASHDVPVSVIAADSDVLDRIDGWGWQPGLVPEDEAPVWRMDEVAGRWVDAFSGRAD